MRDRFLQQLARLEKACRELHERPGNHVVHEEVLGALTAMTVAPHLDHSPLVRGLANVVVSHASILEHHLQDKGSPPDNGKLARAAAQLCGHIDELKQALDSV
jgi:hypothetical protein